MYGTSISPCYAKFHGLDGWLHGKQYYVRHGYSAEVRQYAAGARVWRDGSSNMAMQKTNFKNARFPLQLVALDGI